MFKRDILFHLERWKDDTHRKPLILRGARQVGKINGSQRIWKAV